MSDFVTPEQILTFYSTVSTPFGEDGDRFHYGTDFPHPAGTPIGTPFHGVVVANEPDAAHHGHGNYIVIRVSAIPDWYFAVSHMLSRSPLAVGTWLDPLRILGFVGSTGLSSGPHAHAQMSTRAVPWDHSGLTYDPFPMIWAALDGKPWNGIYMNPPVVPAPPTPPAPIEPPPIVPTDPETIARDLLRRALTAAIDAA